MLKTLKQAPCPGWGLLKMLVLCFSIVIVAVIITVGLVGEILIRDPCVTPCQRFTAFIKKKTPNKVVFKVYKFSPN